MSLSFQNADAVKQAILEELQNLMTAETVALQRAEERIKQLQYTEGYGNYLTEIIMNQNFELPLRQIASIMLARFVEHHWLPSLDENGVETANCIVPEQAKRSIRSILPNGLYDPSSKIRSSVARTISAIAAIDWPNVWTELFDVIVKCLGGNENSIHGATQVLREFSYEETQIKDLGPVIISEVYRIFDSEQLYSIKTRTFALRILKSVLSSISTNVFDKQERHQMVDSILTNFMDKLLHYLSMNCGEMSNFLLRTEIVKIFTFLITDVPKNIMPYMDQLLPVIWQLLTQIARVYVKVVVNQVEPSPFAASDIEEDDEQCNFSNMIIQIFEFIQCVIGAGRFRSLIKNVITDLIYITIVYIQVSVQQMQDWEDDNNKFVEDEDESGVELTIRLSGQDVLVTLNDEHSAKCLPALQEAIRRHMSVAEAEKAADNPDWWKIQEACMVAVHTFSDVILSSDQFDLINYLTFAREMLNYHELLHLEGRALWTLSTYSRSPLYNIQMLEEMLNFTLQSLNPDKSIISKICAVRAVQGFVYSHLKGESDKRNLITTNLSDFLDGILEIIPESTSSVLALVLDTITTMINFDKEFAAASQSRFVPLIIAVFLKYPQDPYILEILHGMIKATSQNELCQQLLQERFLPTLVSILNLEGNLAKTAKQDIALDMLTSIIKHSATPFSNILMQNGFPAMIHCVLRSDDQSVMVSGGECLRAYVFLSPDQIYAYKNGEGLNHVMQLTTMLLNPMSNEMTAGQIGRLVITIITKMGSMIGENVDLLLKAVISKMQLVESLKVIMSLVVVFAHLIVTQMDAVLHFLSTVPGPTGEPAMQFVFNNWFSRQPSFFGAYERKVTTMAMCKLFEHGLTTQDNRLTSIDVRELIPADNLNTTTTTRIKTRSQASTSQQWVSIPALVKMFKLLINELFHLREVKLACFDSDTDDEDDPPSEEKPYVSPPKGLFISDLYFNADDDEEIEDDLLAIELAQNPLFQTNMEEYLVTFLQNFSSSEHFSMFVPHLNMKEKSILRSIQVNAE